MTKENYSNQLLSEEDREMFREWLASLDMQQILAVSADVSAAMNYMAGNIERLQKANEAARKAVVS